jgi:hypothetical protein
LCGGSACAGLIEDWQQYETGVRDQKISKEDAQVKLNDLIVRLSDYITTEYAFADNQSWAVPLKGYGKTAIGRGGFTPNSWYGKSKIKGYDFFDGNKHGGHPAYDIFANDANNDGLDDKTGCAVEICSIVDSVIISTNESWDKDNNGIFDGDDIRGGKYVWAYNPKLNKLFYYAHLGGIIVKSGEFVRKGQVIAVLGRTGSTAEPAKFRSDRQVCPTHLHFMVLEYKNNKLIPFDSIRYYILK